MSKKSAKKNGTTIVEGGNKAASKAKPSAAKARKSAKAAPVAYTGNAGKAKPEKNEAQIETSTSEKPGRVPRTGDPRTPPPGTVLRRTDRQGNVKCECRIEEDGVHYAGKVYRSLSTAAIAAAQDMGLKSKTQNGFLFWQLAKPEWHPTDPIEGIKGTFARYEDKLNKFEHSGADKDTLAKVRTELERHAHIVAAVREALEGQAA